ncbi:hypothetical protein N7461_009621 [Penicillium sp. DV-2018c]|nr:hypothetical protein N7461_009621 [Penicillium sp. DV-2018c]
MPPPPVLSGLTSVSLRVFDLVVEQFHDPPFARPDLLLLDIDGKAGTGKCHPIPPLSATSARMASEAGTPTGVATFNIAGKTLHPLFYLPVKLAGECISLPTSTLEGSRRSSTISAL